MDAASSNFRIRHVPVTVSTNNDARKGRPGDVFWADEQTAGRGRLDHEWLSPPGENLTFSAVVGVDGANPAETATLPLVAGLAVLSALASLPGMPPRWSLKWPNDVLHNGLKVCGILCELHDCAVTVGIGVNVNQRVFVPELKGRATSLCMISPGCAPFSRERILDAILAELAHDVAQWRAEGFASLWPRIAAVDELKGRHVSVLQTDSDSSPRQGACGGIMPDGTLDVGGTPVSAGEAHVMCANGETAR